MKLNQISCIDHIYSNCPNKINNIATHEEARSDNNVLTLNYSNENIINGQTYRIKGDNSKLTKHKLEKYF